MKIRGNAKRKPTIQANSTKSTWPMKTLNIQADEIFDNNYGDIIQQKQKTHIRIGVMNARTIPFEHQTPEKYDALRNTIMEHDFDIIGIGETNKNWTNVPDTRQLKTTFKRWWKNCSTSCAWLRDHTSHDECQTGGTALVTINNMTSHIKQRGEDTRKLGRWTWFTFSGRDNKYTTVITTYRPIDGQASKTKSVKMQQLAIIREKYPQLTQDPLQLYDEDLKELIQDKLHSGHQLIVMGDFNQNVTSTGKTSTTNKMLRSLGLEEQITSKHGSAAPPTFIYGNHPIDGIYTTRHIEPLRYGYLPGNIQISDHRILWMDIDIRSILGEKYYTPQRPRFRKLHASNPRIRNKFNKTMEKQLQQCKVLQKLRKLKSNIIRSGWNNQTMPRQYEICDRLRF